MTTVDCTSALHAGQRYVRQRAFAAMVFSGFPFSWPAASASSPLACNSVCRSRACSRACSCSCCCCCDSWLATDKDCDGASFPRGCWCAPCCRVIASCGRRSRLRTGSSRAAADVALVRLFLCAAIASHVSRRICRWRSFLRSGSKRIVPAAAARLRMVACAVIAWHASQTCVPSRLDGRCLTNIENVPVQDTAYSAD